MWPLLLSSSPDFFVLDVDNNNGGIMDGVDGVIDLI